MTDPADTAQGVEASSEENRAWERWMYHRGRCQKCLDACEVRLEPVKWNCKKGQELWGAYDKAWRGNA